MGSNNVYSFKRSARCEPSGTIELSAESEEQMKVVFIEPRSSGANVYSKFSMPLLGPVYLGTILKQQGHDVEIYNENICEPDYSRLEADRIGISLLTSTAKRGYEIAAQFPREKIIFGGVHASLLPDEALQYAQQVVVGEAETVISDVVEGRLNEPIVYGKPVDDLDKLPYPDFSLVQGYCPSSLIVPISTSRGCPHDCSFCSVTKMFGRAYRFRSAEDIMKELRSRTAKSFFFCDDNFTAHPQRTRLLLHQMIEDKIDHWSCQVRCDIAKDNELLSLMARAGCKVVCVGFESINPMTLNAYQKKQTVADIVSSIRSFHKKRIKIHGMFVLGGEDDSKRTVWETVKFAMRQRIDTIQMTILTPFPGTKVYEELKEQKRIFTKDWSLYDCQHIVFKPKLLSARDLQRNVMSAYARFYSFSNAILLIVRWNFRNALLRLMGKSLIKEWMHTNRTMRWVR
jgi:radical SAM superfamily enzyme YgiQ (UPF0313 family)